VPLLDYGSAVDYFGNDDDEPGFGFLELFPDEDDSPWIDCY